MKCQPVIGRPPSIPGGIYKSRGHTFTHAWLYKYRAGAPLLHMAGLAPNFRGIYKSCTGAPFLHSAGQRRRTAVQEQGVIDRQEGRRDGGSGAARLDVVAEAANLAQIFGLHAAMLVAVSARFLCISHNKRECTKFEWCSRRLRVLGGSEYREFSNIFLFIKKTARSVQKHSREKKAKPQVLTLPGLAIPAANSTESTKQEQQKNYSVSDF